MNNNKNLQKFLNQMKTAAEKDTNGIISETAEIKNELTATAEKEAKSETAVYLSAAEKRIKREFMEKYSALTVKAKAEYLEERKALCDGLFNKATEKIADFTKTEDYKDFLVNVAKSLKLLGDYIFIISKNDEKYADLLKPYCVGIEIFSGETLGGIRAKTADGSIFIDDSLESRLQKEKEHFIEKSELII